MRTLDEIRNTPAHRLTKEDVTGLDRKSQAWVSRVQAKGKYRREIDDEIHHTPAYRLTKEHFTRLDRKSQAWVSRVQAKNYRREIDDLKSRVARLEARKEET